MSYSVLLDRSVKVSIQLYQLYLNDFEKQQEIFKNILCILNFYYQRNQLCNRICELIERAEACMPWLVLKLVHKTITASQEPATRLKRWTTSNLEHGFIPSIYGTKHNYLNMSRPVSLIRTT